MRIQYIELSPNVATLAIRIFMPGPKIYEFGYEHEMPIPLVHRDKEKLVAKLMRSGLDNIYVFESYRYEVGILEPIHYYGGIAWCKPLSEYEDYGF